MGCRAVLSSSASKELKDSFAWYENRTKDLGLRFINFIDMTIDYHYNDTIY